MLLNDFFTYYDNMLETKLIANLSLTILCRFSYSVIALSEQLPTISRISHSLVFVKSKLNSKLILCNTVFALKRKFHFF